MNNKVLELLDMWKNYITKLKEYHFEMEHLLNELEKYEDGVDCEDFYNGMERDLMWDNRMLSFRLKKVKSHNYLLDYSNTGD